MNNNIKVKVYKKPGAKLPIRATSGSAALDVYSCLPPDIILTVPPFERILVPTGLFFEIPTGYHIAIRARSGLALKKGLILPNAPGTIDSDYRGELQILVANIDKNEKIIIEHGERIAQMLLEKNINFDWEEQQDNADFMQSQRNDKGFGSTGLC